MADRKEINSADQLAYARGAMKNVTILMEETGLSWNRAMAAICVGTAGQLVDAIKYLGGKLPR